MVSVEKKLEERRGLKEAEVSFTFEESLQELCELCGTAGISPVSLFCSLTI